jgi:hypothetical protein
METKPYSLQAPEQIAKEYAGNKQKIGQAAKMGLLDPTAAVLAGMFIDRMRTAQIQEQGPQQTVAQQVLSPTVPPMSPQAPGAPPPGAPPQAGLGAIPPQGGGMPPPPPQGPVGMAAGGYVGDENFGSSMVNGNYGSVGAPFNVGQSQQNNGAMFSNGMPQDGSNETFSNGIPQTNGGYASGGLSAIDLPPEMFDEPRNGGFNNGFNNNYAGGGIVAFAEAGPVTALKAPSWEEMTKMALNVLGTPGGEAIDAERAYYKDAPARLQKQRREDMWMSLAQLGANMAATKSPYFLQAAGEAAQSALPGLATSAKERRAEERSMLKGAADMERGDYAAKAKAVDVGTSLYGTASQQYEGALGREQQAKLQTERLKQEEKLFFAGQAGEDRRAQIRAAAVGSGQRPDLMEQAVAAEYQKLKEMDAQGILKIPSGKNRNLRYSDAALKSMAFSNVFGTRYGDKSQGATPASISVYGAGNERPNTGGGAQKRVPSTYNITEEGTSD